MKDKEFDNIIKQHFANAPLSADVQFDEANWNNMEQLLDKKKRRRRPFIFWFILIGVLLIGSIFWVMNNKEAKNSQAVNTKQSQSQDQDLSTKNTTNSSTKNITESNKKEVTESNKNKISSQHNNQNSIMNKDDQQSNNNNAVNSSSNNRIVISSINTKALASLVSSNKNKNKQYGNAMIAITNAAKKSRKQNKNDKINGDKASNTTLVARVPFLDDDTTMYSKNAINTTENKTDSAIVKLKPAQDSLANKPPVVKNKNNKKAKLNKFEIIAFGTADATTVGFKKVFGISPGYGISLGYNVNKKLAISAGVSYVKKVYTTDTNGYKKSFYPSPTSYQVTFINADCRIIEVPVNIAYTFSTKGKNSFTASLGFSSFFMQKETYDYEYLRGTIPYLVTAEFKNNKHYFASLNAGVDYKRALNKNLSLLLGTFIQAPLKGVGEGTVNLYSAGLKAGVSFKF